MFDKYKRRVGTVSHPGVTRVTMVWLDGNVFKELLFFYHVLFGTQ